MNLSLHDLHANLHVSDTIWSQVQENPCYLDG